MKKAFLITCMVLTILPLSAQFRYGYFSIGASTGSTNYLGDLDDDFTFRYSRGGLGLDVKYRLNPFMSARVGFFQGWARAADSVSSNEARARRNLHFRTPISEINAQVIFDFIPNDRRFNYRPGYTPYVFFGISLFRFNPRALYQGRWVDLQPVGTEGQNTGLPEYPEPYALVQVAIPMGAGMRFSLTNFLDLELESGFRKTFTDYLDDVSGEYPDLDLLSEQAQTLADPIDRTLYPEGGRAVNGIRGDATQSDWYIYTNVRLNLILDWRRCPKFPSRRR